MKDKKTMKSEQFFNQESEQDFEQKPDKKSIDVKIVSQQGKSAVVEYIEDGLPVRVLLPVKQSYSEKDLQAGVPASFRWDKKVKLEANTKILAQKLYDRNIWTLDDARKNPRAVIGALQETYAVDLAAILSAGKEK